MHESYPSNLVRKITGATNNQLKYWIKIGLLSPRLKGKVYYYTFREILKIRLIVSLKKSGMSLQKVKKGISNLTQILPHSHDSLSRLVIFTDGFDMIVTEKGKYFNATTMQRFFRFDTELIKADIIQLQSKAEALTETVKIKVRLS